MSAGETEKVDEHPSGPSEEAGQFGLGDDSLAAADGSHSAEVVIEEGEEVRVAVDKLKDIFGDDGGLPKLSQ